MLRKEINLNGFSCRLGSRIMSHRLEDGHEQVCLLLRARKSRIPNAEKSRGTGFNSSLFSQFAHRRFREGLTDVH